MLKKATVEASIVGHYHSAGQALEHIAQDSIKGGSVAYISTSNPVNVSGTKVPFRTEKSAPDISRLPTLVQADYGELDDPVVRTRMEASRLAVDYCEGAWFHGYLPFPTSMITGVFYRKSTLRNSFNSQI